MRLKWRLRAQQHLVILSHVFITADTGLLGRLANTQEGGETWNATARNFSLKDAG
ncbi:TPA: hypothetical protein R6463_003206 [Klebsiella pneumoniae]|nr:hypothetical protein [Klebsiella pneumoniae]HEE1184786.1 hypothetical protein [Klebsiella pneumoniae]